MLPPPAAKVNTFDCCPPRPPGGALLSPDSTLPDESMEAGRLLSMEGEPVTATVGVGAAVERAPLGS